MSDDSNLQFTIKFVDPELDLEERDAQAMQLLSELREVEEVEEIRQAIDPNPPEGNKSSGGAIAGVVTGVSAAGSIDPIFNFIGERSANKNIEMELTFNDRTLRIAATSKEEMQALVPLLQQFITESKSSNLVSVEAYSILMLTANPAETSRLRLDEEMRDIKEGLRRSKWRDRISLTTESAVRSRDIQRAMLDVNPSIVHFSGHGVSDESGAGRSIQLASEREEGLMFEDSSGGAQLIDGESLAGIFQLFADRVDCVVLNGCHSEVQASAIAQHVDYVIGMNRAIEDRSAIEFSVGFYDALGAGRSIEFAFELGRNAIRLAQLQGYDIPVLKRKAF